MSRTIQAVIIGNGPAAIQGIRGLRGAGFRGAIKLISDEDLPAYHPMLLPYYIGGVIKREEAFICDQRFYVSHGVERKMLARNARKLAEEYGCDKIGDKLNKLYETILEKKEQNDQ